MAKLGFIDIRPGEGVAVFKATLTLFCIIAGHTLLETARDALFLVELPPSRLAAVYALLAGLAVVASRASTALVIKFGRRTALLLTLLTFAYGTTVFYLMPKTKPFVFAFYVWSGLLGSITVVQFWMLSNQWFTVAQGKRLFAPISSGGVLGAVTGASLAMLALEFFSVEQLMLLGVGAFVAASITLTTLDVEESAPRRASRLTPAESARAMAYLKEHPYLAYIAALLAVSTSALLVTDYLFKSVAARSFAPDELGSFFATYYAALNVLALLVQFAVSSYLVRRFGILAAFLVLPLLLLGGGVALLAAGGVLVIVLLTKAADGGLRHSLHRIASELLWMPLPEHVKAESKSFVDTVVVRATQALTAAALFAMAAYGLDEPRVLAGMLCALVGIWIAVGVGLRRPYLRMFRAALGNERNTRQELELDVNAVEVIIEALSSRDPERAIAAIELLAANQRDRLIPALILYHESDAVLVAALSAIARRDRSDWVPLAQRLLDHASEEVRVAAMRALVENGVPEAARERLYDVSPRVRGQAAFLVASEAGVARPHEHPAVMEILSMSGRAGVEAQSGLLQSIHGHNDVREHGDTHGPSDARWADLVLKLAQDPDDDVVEAAAMAMTRLHDTRFIPILLGRLGSRRGRSAVRDAIVAHGEPALARLEDLLEDPDTEARIQRHIPRTISRFNNQRAADILARTLESDAPGAIRYKALRGLSRIVAEAPVRVDRRLLERQMKANLVEHLRMRATRHFAAAISHDANDRAVEAQNLLADLLADKAAQARERAFRLLHVAHRHEDIRSVASATESGDRKVRAQALEYLDALLLDSSVADVRELFGLVADDLAEGERLKRAHSLVVDLPTDEHRAMSSLIHDSDEVVAAIATYFALQVSATEYRRDISEVATQPGLVALLDEHVRQLFASDGEPGLAT